MTPPEKRFLTWLIEHVSLDASSHMTLEELRAALDRSAPLILKELKAKDAARTKTMFLSNAVTGMFQVEMKSAARCGDTTCSSVWLGLRLKPIERSANDATDMLLRLCETELGTVAVYASLQAVRLQENSRKVDLAYAADDLLQPTINLRLKKPFMVLSKAVKLNALEREFKEVHVFPTPQPRERKLDDGQIFEPPTEPIRFLLRTPLGFDGADGVDAPKTVTRFLGKFSVATTIDLLLEDGTRLHEGTWYDSDGRILLSPQLLGNALDCWPLEGTDYKIRLGKRFYDLPVESPASSSSTSSTSSTSSRASAQLEFASDSQFVRSVFTHTEIPEKIKCGFPLFKAAYTVAVEQWKMDFSCPYADILVQTIKHYLPAYFPVAKPVFETPAGKA